MNYFFENVDQKEIFDWINQAIQEKAKIVVICYDEESNSGGFEPFYFAENVLDEKMLQIINEHDERYSFRGIIDVKAELQRSINEGMTGFNYKAAKVVWPDLKL